jgi:hypothetical protein
VKYGLGPGGGLVDGRRIPDVAADELDLIAKWGQPLK